MFIWLEHTSAPTHSAFLPGNVVYIRSSYKITIFALNYVEILTRERSSTCVSTANANNTVLISSLQIEENYFPFGPLVLEPRVRPSKSVLHIESPILSRQHFSNIEFTYIEKIKNTASNMRGQMFDFTTLQILSTFDIWKVLPCDTEWSIVNFYRPN